MKLVLPLFWLLLPYAATADQQDDWAALVARAADAYDDSFRDRWSFTETRREGDSVRIAKYSPADKVEDRWTLVSVDDAAPTDKQIKKFLEEKQDRAEEREADDDNGLDAIIQPGSLQLIEETDEFWRFSFQPLDDDDEEFMRNVDGELEVSKARHFIRSMHLASREPFKPQTGVKINTFEMRMTFGTAGEDNAIVPQGIATVVSGKAFFVHKFDEKVDVSYDGFEPATASAK